MSITGQELITLNDPIVQNENNPQVAYNVVRFNPDIVDAKIMPVSYLVNPDTATTPINSYFFQVPGSHTPQSCAMNAAIINANNKNEEKKILPPPMNPGLKFLIVDGYFNDNVNFFLTAPAATSNIQNRPAKGVVKKFRNIIEGTNSSIPALHTIHYYSVEWTGYFIPDETGIWLFFINSDDASYMWLGDNAMVGYTEQNALLKDPRPHGMVTKASSSNPVNGQQISLVAGQKYPIRMQFGEAGGGNNFVFGFKSPSQDYGYNSGAGYDGSPSKSTAGGSTYFLFPNDQTTTSPIDATGTLFSLVNQNPGEGNNPNFACYIYGNQGQPNVVQGLNKPKLDYSNNHEKFLQQNLSDVTVAVAWKLINSNSGFQYYGQGNDTITLNNGILYLNNNFPITKLINSGTTASYSAIIQDDGQFVIKCSNGTTSWALNQINNEDNYIATGDGTGNTIIGTSRIATSTLDEIKALAIVNNVWLNTQNTTDRIQTGQSIGQKGTVPYLISQNGKYKIDVDAGTGNLQLKISIRITPDTLDINSNIPNQPKQYKFTNLNDPYVHLYSVQADSRMTNMYSYKNADAQMSQINPNARILNYQTQNYSPYTGYYPTSPDKGKQMDSKACATACSTDPKCMYYYTYNFNGAASCYTDNGQQPISFAVSPNATTANINPNDSTLYLKNPDIKISAQLANPASIVSTNTNTFSGGPSTDQWNNVSKDPSPLNSMDMLKDPLYEDAYLAYVNYVSGSSYNQLYLQDSTTNTPVQKTFSMKQGFTVREGFDTPVGVSASSPLIETPTYGKTSNLTGTGVMNATGFVDNTPKTSFSNPGPPIPWKTIKFDGTDNTSVVRFYGWTDFTLKPDASVPYYNIVNVSQPINNWQNGWNPNSNKIQLTSSNQEIQPPTNANLSFASIVGGLTFPTYADGNGSIPSIVPKSYNGQIVKNAGHKMGLTFTFWFKSNYSSLWSRLFDFGSSTRTGSRLAFCMMPNGIGFFDNGGWRELDTDTSAYSRSAQKQGCNDNYWHFVYWVIHTDGTPWTIYVDGKQIQSNTLPTSGIPTGNLSAALFAVSLWFIPNGDPFFNGAISDFNIYDCTLEYNYVEDYYNSTKSKYNTSPAIINLNRNFSFYPLDYTNYQFINTTQITKYVVDADGHSYQKWTGGMYLDKVGPQFCITNDLPNRLLQMTKGTADNNSGALKLNGNQYAVIDPIVIGSQGAAISFWFSCKTSTSSTGYAFIACDNNYKVIMGMAIFNNKVWVTINDKTYDTKITIQPNTASSTTWNLFMWQVLSNGTSQISVNGSPIENVQFAGASSIGQQTIPNVVIGYNYTWMATNWNGIPNSLKNGAFVQNNSTKPLEWATSGSVVCTPSPDYYSYFKTTEPWGFYGVKCVVLQGPATISQSMFLTPTNYTLGYWHCQRPGYGDTSYKIILTHNDNPSIKFTYEFNSDSYKSKNRNLTSLSQLTTGWTNVNIGINVVTAGNYTLTIQNLLSNSDNAIGIAYIIFVTGDKGEFDGYVSSLRIYNTGLADTNTTIEQIYRNNLENFEGMNSRNLNFSIIEGMNATKGSPSTSVIPSLNPQITVGVQKGVTLNNISYVPPQPNYSSGFKPASEIYNDGSSDYYSIFKENIGKLKTLASNYSTERSQLIHNANQSGAQYNDQNTQNLGTIASQIPIVKKNLGDNTYNTQNPTADPTSSPGFTQNLINGYGGDFDPHNLYGISTIDVAKQDTREMILQENTVYSIGLITCATLLIAGIMIARE